MKNEKKEENETTQANKMGRKTITGNTHTKSALLKLSQKKSMFMIGFGHG